MYGPPGGTMSLRCFEGPAGSGKTTRLVAELATVLGGQPLREHERVLALTKMHGSRLRMQARLRAQPALHRRFECVTIDSLAWRLCRRWRSFVRTMEDGAHAPGSYAATCRLAGRLLADAAVCRWVTRSCPVVVVDEMQDSRDGQLDMLRGLSQSATCVAAADAFQDLDASGENRAVAWARQAGEIVSLTGNHRTTAHGLLAAAGALRDGRTVPPRGRGFAILGAYNANVGASYMSKTLAWWTTRHDVAVISPVRADRSRFVDELLGRVARGPIGQPSYGPYSVPWEVSQEEQVKRFVAELELPPNLSTTIEVGQIPLRAGDGASNGLRQWLDRQRRIAGRTTFSGTEILEQTLRTFQRSSAYGPMQRRGARAMTVHRAKNREFDYVIVLWPYEAGGALERQRRLLYNAITRARRGAVVIVQGRERCGRPPFVAEASGPGSGPPLLGPDRMDLTT